MSVYYNGPRNPILIVKAPILGVARNVHAGAGDQGRLQVPEAGASVFPTAQFLEEASL